MHEQAITRFPFARICFDLRMRATRFTTLATAILIALNQLAEFVQIRNASTSSGAGMRPLYRRPNAVG
ncbi:MAG: hypothetical protein ACI8UD_002385 [Planctomycetota bacterium]|jgi:hypothetical protein